MTEPKSIHPKRVREYARRSAEHIEAQVREGRQNGHSMSFAEKVAAQYRKELGR